MTADGTLRSLLDADGVVSRLVAAGHRAERAAVVQRQLRSCADALRRGGASPAAPAHAFVVPGRIEVLGKHTDYAGGRSILAVPERGFAIVAVRRDDQQLRVADVGQGASACVDLDPALPPAEGWVNYAATVARRVARDFPGARAGASIALTSDLPAAAGMSSSSALVVALFSVVAAVNRLAEDPRYRAAVATPEELAGYVSALENGQAFGPFEGGGGGVGTHGGSEDHTAMLCARRDGLVQYAFAPVRFERALPLPPGHRFVIASSGVTAEKAGAARERYNSTSSMMHAAAALWRAATGRDEPTVGAALAAVPAAADRLRAAIRTARDLPFPREALLARVEQFVAEDREIIPAAGDAVERGDLVTFGALVDRSQALAERLLGNQIDETMHLARSARDAGAVAASAFGAGFGGSVWALVEDAAVDPFQQRWQADYATRFPERAANALFFQTGAGIPTTRVW